VTVRTYNNLHDYQRFAIATGVNLKNVAYFLGTGLGKTAISLAVIDQLMKRKLIQNTLVVGTKKIIYNSWRQEAEEWKPLSHLSFSIIHGDAHGGSPESSRRRGFHANSHIKLINYEGLPWLAEYLQKMHYDNPRSKFPFQCIVYDESTKMKHSTTQRFRVFKKYMGLFPYRYILTGTPIPNGLMDLFGQMYVLDIGESLGTVLSNFRSKYFMIVGSIQDGSRKYIPFKTTKEVIQKRIKRKVIYMKKEDYVELPPIHYNPIKLDLPAKLRGQYEELERTFFLDLEGAEVEAFSAASLSMKLRQFLQGRMYTYGEEGKRSTIDIHTEKLDYLKELHEEIEGLGNCIIAYNFIFEREDLLSIFPNAPVIDGSAKDKEVSKAIQEWNKGQHPILLFNPASDPHGLNLQFGGNQILWYSLTYNLEHYVQLIDRVYRQLQKRNVFVHHLLFRNTLDEMIYGVLTQKDANQTQLLAALKQYKEKKGY